MTPIAKFPLVPIAGLLLAAASLEAAEIATLNTTRTFPKIATQGDWQKRAIEIRGQINASCGLWPMPEKTPLNARVFGRIEHADYSVEKVLLETHPGVFLGGNLYRPLRTTQTRYPAILNPHGHWDVGRLVDSETGSVPARCIQFARMGIVAFAYDMVGYNDTTQFNPRKEDGSPEFPRYYDGHVRFAQDMSDQLWGISLMGLNTWNGIRALDFLMSLPDVDPTRIACTGASGGGTQTFMLGAIDPRLAAQAPMVMVSHTMQGGCWCENSPGLRVRFSNMEIAAAAAPRPQLLVSATGDWTKTTMEVEGPAIADIYHLFGPGNQFLYKRFDFPHNYNQTTREAAYAFMAEYLLNRTRQESLPEQAYKMDPPKEMRIISDNQVLPGAKSRDEFKAYFKEQTRLQLTARWPTKRDDLKMFKADIGPIYRAVFQLSPDPQQFEVKVGTTTQLANEARVSTFEINGQNPDQKIPVRVAVPQRGNGTAVVLASPMGSNTYFDVTGNPVGFAEQLLAGGHAVVTFDAFLTGSRADNAEAARRDHAKDFFSTYNRTDLQERVGDLIAVCAFTHSHLADHKVVLLGREEAGLWALLAAPAADAVVADAIQFEANDDQLWTHQNWLTPSIRRIGTFDGPALLAAPNPVLIHNTGKTFPTKTIAEGYERVGAAASARIHQERLSDAALLKWIGTL